MLSFSARGKIFNVPYKYILENINENVLLRIMALMPENMNEKIDNCIFIDINPVYLNDILNFVYKKSKLLSDLDYENDILCRELCYLSVLDEYEPDWVNFTFHKNDLKCDNKNSLNHENDNKIITITTSDNKTIKLLSSSVDLWKESLFKDIIYGRNEKYIISKIDDNINVWIDINYKICNIIISIMRDGINVYHKLLDKNAIIKKNIIHYGICEQFDLDVLANRIKRMYYFDTQKKRKCNNVDIENERAYCFDKDEYESGKYVEYKNNWRGGSSKIGPFHTIKNIEFVDFFNRIKKDKMLKVDKTEFVGYRDYYDETTWTYSMDKKEMELIEHYYFKYLMGYN